jgi:GAF domain-containing protein
MSDLGLQKVLDRLSQNILRDNLVQQVTYELRSSLDVNRVVLYYFYYEWKGQVTFESISSPEYSIFGSSGPDNCFNEEYAILYQAGRVRAIDNIETVAVSRSECCRIADCHRDFLRQLQVRANLAVPILTSKGLWGLLIAHHCQSPRFWSIEDIELMQKGATTLAKADSIRPS